MFKKHFRLKTSEFKEVFDYGKTVKTPLCLIKMKQNKLKYSRFAVVVSKKISKRAVERNHLKRRFMSAVKEVKSNFPIFDYIFILNSGVKDIQYKDLLNNLKQINL